MEKNRELYAPVHRHSMNRFDTAFWQKAYESLPLRARREHAFRMRSAERWELRADAAIELWSRAVEALARAFRLPKPTH
jgi:hypothetical protein